MTLNDIADVRLANQQITGTQLKSVKEIVQWLGAIQAQDYPMAKWAVGLRLPDSTLHSIETAIEKGEILRTHVMRPTWHLVAAEDIHWMLELTKSQIKTSLKTRHRQLEITDAVLKKSNKVLMEALSGNNHLPREEIASRFEKVKITTGNNRLSHLLLYAELDGLICSGRSNGNKQTYALLDERVDRPKSISRDLSLERLVNKYFLSHGPATLQDFTWWSGLTIKEARSAIETVKNNFISEKVGSDTYWLSNSINKLKNEKPPIFLLPAFDEFLVSYKNRIASLSEIQYKKAVSDNGIFRPVIILEGQVIGLWKRTVKGDFVIIETQFFRSVNNKILNQIELVGENFGHFVNKKTVVKHNNIR